MNLKQARYMMTVLREGSITGAAKRLYISQPSLSQMIKLAEQNLGAPIFDRSTEPITLTYAGKRYMEAAKKMLSIYENLTNEIREINNESSGLLRLGIPLQRGMQLLPSLIPDFLAMYPQVTLELEESGSDTLENMVEEGRIDIGLITTNPKRSELEYELIGEEKLMLLSDRRTELAQRVPGGTGIGIEQAKDESFIALKAGHSVRTIQDRLFFAADIAPKIKMETNSLEAAKRVTVGCNAVMLCPYVYIKSEQELLEKGVCYPILGNNYERNFYACYRRELYMPRYMRELIRLVQSLVRENDVPFSPLKGGL
ncbi:MAG: LysR family transcriptional regulator, partial [Oscillospiraceae bacterium]